MFDLKRFLHTLKTTKRYWIPLFIVVFLGLSGLYVVMPKKFQSSAMVKINEPRVTNVAGAAVQILDINDYLRVIREQISSFSFLESVARELNLTRGVPPNTPDYDAIINRVQSGIDVRVKGRDLFTVTYQAGSAEEARDVTAVIVKQYILRFSDDISARADEQTQFMRNELAAAERALRSAQDEVTKYKEQFPNEIPDVQANQLRRLNELRGLVQTAQGTIQGHRNALDLMQRRLKDTPADIVSQSTVAAASSEKSTLERKKKDLESNLTMLRLDFTDKHPRVIEAQAMLDQIQREIDAIQEAPATTETRVPNPQHGVLLESITGLETQIAQTQSSIAKMTQEIAQLEEWQKSVPKRELELSRLESAARAQNERVELFRRKLNEAQTAANMEERGQGPSFELADPPRLNVAPVAPSAKKFILMGFAGGGAMAMGLVYLLMLFDNAVRSVEEARRMLQMPVLGVVQRVVTASELLRQARRRRMRNLGAGAGVLLAVTVVTLGLTVLREPLKRQVEVIRTTLSERMK